MAATASRHVYDAVAARRSVFMLHFGIFAKVALLKQNFLRFRCGVMNLGQRFFAPLRTVLTFAEDEKAFPAILSEALDDRQH